VALTLGYSDLENWRLTIVMTLAAVVVSTMERRAESVDESKVENLVNRVVE